MVADLDAGRESARINSNSLGISKETFRSSRREQTPLRSTTKKSITVFPFRIVSILIQQHRKRLSRPGHAVSSVQINDSRRVEGNRRGMKLPQEGRASNFVPWAIRNPAAQS